MIRWQSDLLNMYHIRALEEKAEQVYMQGKIHGTMHLFIGMEDSAVGRTVQRQIVIETEQGDGVVVRPMMSMTLSADHWVLDGAQCAKFLLIWSKWLRFFWITGG